MPTKNQRHVRRSSVQARLALVWFLTSSLFSGPVHGLFDPTKTPVVLVPIERWGELEPGPILGDSTFHRLGTIDPPPVPYWFDLDIEGDYLFTVTGLGFQIYDLSIPLLPRLLYYAKANDALPYWEPSDRNDYLVDVDAPGNGAPGDPDGSHDGVVIAAQDQGLVIWNTRFKVTAWVHYQDAGGVIVDSVYSAKLGGRSWAIAADNTNDGGLLLYDMTAAASLTRCLENTKIETVCGVYRGRIGAQLPVVEVRGAGDFIAARRAPRNLEIWNVANPLLPIQRIVGQLPGFTSELAMWKDTRVEPVRHYLAAIGTQKLWIYDVSCITGAGACALPAPVTVDVPEPSSATAQQIHLSFSWNGTTPFLYVGNFNEGTSCVSQREYLIDVSSPAAPRFVQQQPGGDDYWGWYYATCSTGFNYMRPMHAKFHPASGYLYRAAYSFIDSHYLADPHPPIFSDGFENGTLSAWSAAVP